MQHAHTYTTSSPWRAATLAVAAVAAVELVGLLVLAGVRLAPAGHQRTAAAPKPAAVHARLPARHVEPSHALRPRRKVTVLILNGNGVAGAASAAAGTLEVAGYRIGDTGNAQRHDYARSIVMYTPGWAREAHRLARDAHVPLVTPVDGVPRAQLKGSKLVLLLGT